MRTGWGEADGGQIVTGWLLRILLTVAAVGFVLLEAGSVVYNRVAARDVADQAAAEAGISYLAAGGSLQAAEEQAKEYVAQNHAEFVELRVDPTGGTVFVTVRRKASTRVVHRIGAFKKYVLYQTTGSAPLRR